MLTPEILTFIYLNSIGNYLTGFRLPHLIQHKFLLMLSLGIMLSVKSSNSSEIFSMWVRMTWQNGFFCFKHTGEIASRCTWSRKLNFHFSFTNIRPFLSVPRERIYTMSFASKGVLQIEPLSFRKQSLDIMVTFSNNSLREINTRVSLLRFLIHEELMECLIYCTRSNEVSSFSLKSNHKFYKYASVV